MILFPQGQCGFYTSPLRRVQPELQARQTDATEARNAKRLAQLNLCRLLAVPQDTPLVFEGDLDWMPLETPLDEMLEAAEQNIKRAKGGF